MPKIEATSYGYRMTVAGYLPGEEAHAFFDQVRATISAHEPHHFGLMIDLRGHKASPPETAEEIKELMRWLKGAGLERSAVVVDNPIARMQVTRLARVSGLDAWERYVDAVGNPGWEADAVAWIALGEEPAQERMPQSA